MNGEIAPSRCFGVIDPASPDAGLWRSAFGSDAVELVNSRVWVVGRSRFLRVNVGAMGESGLIRACRALAEAKGRTFDEVYFDAFYGVGIFVDAKHVRLCEDPNEGRRYWLSQAWKGGESS